MIITRQQGGSRKARPESARLRHPPRRRVRQVSAALSIISCPSAVLHGDCRCSTIGPICSTNLGMRAFAMHSHITAVRHAHCHHRGGCSSPPTLAAAGTVDVGVPQLSMHSIREMCGVDDVRNSPLRTTLFLSIEHRAGAQLQVTRAALSRRFQGA
jgi:aspartyl aminopeptidase